MKNKKRLNIKKMLKKIKSFFVKLIKLLIRFFVGLKKKFMKLKPTVRYIIYVWLGVFVILLLFIIVAGNNKKIVDEHTNIEKAIEAASLDYVTVNNVYPSSAKPIKISIDMLESAKHLKDSEITDKTCKGYSIIYYDDATAKYDIKVYISCKKYVTDGYTK